ncbi:MAG: hypothetical protein JXN60_01255, partial [Lentisphaerae bacterium]|nr:hypothetical protein [Lentisphaerota bacterium]
MAIASSWADVKILSKLIPPGKHWEKLVYAEGSLVAEIKSLRMLESVFRIVDEQNSLLLIDLGPCSDEEEMSVVMNDSSNSVSRLPGGSFLYVDRSVSGMSEKVVVLRTKTPMPETPLRAVLYPDKMFVASEAEACLFHDS